VSPTVFLTQLLPLIVFIVVDALVTDVRISIACAVVFALGQLAYTFFKTRQIDWFVVLDVGLIGILGGVSIALENELLFKIKPAIIEAIGVIFMLALILAPERFLLGYLGRLSPSRPLRPEALGMMKTMLGWLSLYTVLHIGAVLYTAFFSSKRTWAVVSGPGFYVIFIPIMIVVLRRAWRARRARRAV
jgi:intracellular septation protein A